MAVALCMLNIQKCMIHQINQKCIIHFCIVSIHKAMTIFVPNFGGQLVRLDMATRF